MNEVRLIGKYKADKRRLILVKFTIEQKIN